MISLIDQYSLNIISYQLRLSLINNTHEQIFKVFFISFYLNYFISNVNPQDKIDITLSQTN